MLRFQNALGWCEGCNVPILDTRECGICGKQSREIHLKGSGEVRPIFEFEKKSLMLGIKNLSSTELVCIFLFKFFRISNSNSLIIENL